MDPTTNHRKLIEDLIYYLLLITVIPSNDNQFSIISNPINILNDIESEDNSDIIIESDIRNYINNEPNNISQQNIVNLMRNVSIDSNLSEYDYMEYYYYNYNTSDLLAFIIPLLVLLNKRLEKLDVYDSVYLKNWEINIMNKYHVDINFITYGIPFVDHHYINLTPTKEIRLKILKKYYNDLYNDNNNNIKTNFIIEKEKKYLCVICYYNSVNLLNIPCRHICLCKSCYNTIKFNNSEYFIGSSCPICRIKIYNVLEIININNPIGNYYFT